MGFTEEKVFSDLAFYLPSLFLLHLELMGVHPQPLSFGLLLFIAEWTPPLKEESR